MVTVMSNRLHTYSTHSILDHLVIIVMVVLYIVSVKCKLQAFTQPASWTHYSSDYDVCTEGQKLDYRLSLS